MRGNFLKDFYKDDGNTVAFGGLIPKVVYQEVKQVGKGESFGELALINNKPRAATAKCKTDTILASLDKESYSKVMAKIQQKKLNEKIDFLKEIP